MSHFYDFAVIGAGVFGSWTAYNLQLSGARVALIDAYGAGNSRASSGGESRIIRMGYGSDEIYTRWSHRSLDLWQKLFEGCGETLFHRTGVLWMARENDSYTQATAATLQRVGVKYEQLDRKELEYRYPQISFGDVSWAIYEPDSGALIARRAVRAVAEAAAIAGAELQVRAILKPEGMGRLNSVKCAGGGGVAAGNFVFACGPWLPAIFPDLLKERIRPTRQEVFFFGTPAGDDRFRSPKMPTWIDFGAETYGLPDLENRGFKLAIDRHGPDFDPETGDRTVTPGILSEVRGFMSLRFPALKYSPLLESRVCQYENTSNGDFLIDRHPDFENVWLIGGGSGHGFKHGPALGEYTAARLTLGGEIEPRFRLEAKEKIRKRAVF